MIEQGVSKYIQYEWQAAIAGLTISIRVSLTVPGKISLQPHTIVKQICFPNGNVLCLSLFFLSKNWMHNVVWGCAEILPRSLAFSIHRNQRLSEAHLCNHGMTSCLMEVRCYASIWLRQCFQVMGVTIMGVYIHYLKGFQGRFNRIERVIHISRDLDIAVAIQERWFLMLIAIYGDLMHWRSRFNKNLWIALSSWYRIGK